MKSSFTRALVVVVASIPLTVSVSFAAGGFDTLGGVITSINKNIVSGLTTLFASAAVAAFFFGMVQFILASREGNDKKLSDGKNFMLWGMIALFVIFSVFGIIKYGQGIFGIQNGSTIVIPQVVGAGTVTPNTGTGNGDTGLPVGGTPYSLCPDGVTKYYNPSDYKYCPGYNSGTSGSNSSDCTGKSQFSSCTIGGKAGTCDANAEGVWGCYAAETNITP